MVQGQAKGAPKRAYPRSLVAGYPLDSPGGPPRGGLRKPPRRKRLGAPHHLPEAGGWPEGVASLLYILEPYLRSSAANSGYGVGKTFSEVNFVWDNEKVRATPDKRIFDFWVFYRPRRDSFEDFC